VTAQQPPDTDGNGAKAWTMGDSSIISMAVFDALSDQQKGGRFIMVDLFEQGT